MIPLFMHYYIIQYISYKNLPAITAEESC